MDVHELKRTITAYQELLKTPCEDWDDETFRDYDNIEQVEIFWMGAKWVEDPNVLPQETSYPGHRYVGRHLVVGCSDTFAYACGDMEHVPDDEYAKLWAGYKKFGYNAIIAYVPKKRGSIQPIGRNVLDPEAVAYFEDGFV